MNPSGLSCPLSRYRPGLQVFYSVNKEIRPADRQRLLSANPAVFTAMLMEAWLPPPFTVLPAKMVIRNSRPECAAARREFSIFCYSDQRFVLYGPFGLSLETGLFRLPGKGEVLRHSSRCPYGDHPTAFRVIPFFRRSSIVPAANAVLLTCIPPAQQRIFCHYGIPERSRVRSTGHCHGYPHGFSPMQAFRLLPQPKASVSQSS